ncbi:unnamed protein product [Adineta steineri]|uniref:Uncharacterized protein n=1 Tax=Adineta steineri TaxID=433720 RepID=A0A813W4V9_9BILA|nr:unnamed protein product [Adineta steineri]CAF1329605.1 unnamed protein product [Adineta steineri]
MLVALCFAVGHAACIVTNQILFGRITGIFAQQSFAADCHDQQLQFISRNINKSVCPLGIELSLSNDVQLHKLCHLNETILSSLSPPMFSFREQVMDIVRSLFIVGIAIYLCYFGKHMIWTLAIKRQTSRMRVLLFRSLLQRLVAKEAKNELESYSKAGQIVQEVFSSLRTVHSLNGSRFEQQRYNKELDPTYWSSIRKGVVLGVYIGWLRLLTQLIYAVGYIFGSILKSYGNEYALNIGDIIIVVNIFAQSLFFLSMIGPYFQSFSEARGAAMSVFRLIDEGEDRDVNESDLLREKESIYDMIGDIEFDNVNLVYPSRKETTVLHNLSFTARANQITALVGSSGSGKSTCISLLLRFYEPSSGRIMIDDRSITDYHRNQLRLNIGVVSQEPILFGMSIYENIRLGKLNATRKEIDEAAKEANAYDFIMKLPNKFETIVGERGVQLSGGEKQRVALARALVKQPSILLLDEATSALDNVSEKLVQEALNRASKNRTTIVIAHRLSTIRNAYQIYMIDKGSVIEEGNHETLMRKEQGKYQTMVKSQQLEKTNDDQDEIVKMTTRTDEDEKQICVLLFALHIFQNIEFAISGSKLTQRIRSKAFACLLRQEVAYFDRPENSSGAITVRLSSNASAIQDMIGTTLGLILQGFALFLFGLVFGLLFSRQLTLIMIFPFVLLLISAYVNVRLTVWLKTRTDLIIGRASSLAVEVLQNMRTVKQLSIENEMLRQYSHLINEAMKTSWKPEIVSGMFFGLIWAVDPVVLGFLYWQAMNLVEQVYSVVSHHSAKRIGSALSAVKIFFDLFDRIPTIDNSSTSGQELVDFGGEIEFDKVKFAYPCRPTTVVLNKLKMNIKPGQRVALVGTSGCGKSTIIQLLERFYDVTHGQLFLDGVDIRDLNLQWLRSQLGVVSQEPILFDLTIAENITYGLQNVPSIDEIIKAATKANIHQFIQQLPQGYETRVGVKGSFLSGGEKQRIAIARVLLRRPKILLLDEATSAMDSYNEQVIQETLGQAQNEDSSRTSLIIAHRLSTIRTCDVIYVLDKGCIIESGTHAESVQQHGIYYEMLTAQNNSSS